MDRIDKLITIVMTTFDNLDFTLASIWAIISFYPDVRIILADGGSSIEITEKMRDLSLKNDSVDFLQYYNGQIEDCRNMCAAIVDTEFIIFMDNDTKVLGREAIPLLLEVMDEDVAQTGAYGVKIHDYSKEIAFVGTEFTSSMELDASPCTFGLHRAKAYKQVGGMPKEWLYDRPKEYIPETVPGYNGDIMISFLYHKAGWRVVSPNQRIPILHWGQANRWMHREKPMDDYSKYNSTHIRCNPLNDYKDVSTEAIKKAHNETMEKKKLWHKYYSSK